MRIPAAILVVLTGCYSSGDPDTDLESAWYEESAQERRDGKSDTGGCSGVKVPDQSGFDRRIALTFDDGPNYNTRNVMRILREHDAPATFFAKGELVAGSGSTIAEEIVEDPLFILGNHTWDHPNMRNLGASSAASQIDRTASAIAAAGGEPSFFRFPYGQSNCTTAQLVRERGYHVVGWHIDSADWCFQSGGGYCRESTFADPTLTGYRDDMVAYVLKQARSWNGGVLLFHDIHSNTVNNLDRILNELEAEGFTFTSLDDVDAFPRLNGGSAPPPPPPDSFIGDPCESETDCHFTGSFCLPADEISGGYCTKACTSTCPDRAGYATTRCVAAPDGYGSSANLCAISCSDGECRDGLSCQPFQSPSGIGRYVCWE